MSRRAQPTPEPEFDESDPRRAADSETEARYPVENGAVRWTDAANEGNTKREPQE